MATDLASTASEAAFPLGGIGTGTVSIGARGELRDWEIFNAPDKGRVLPYTFFAIRAGEQTRVLESRLRPPYTRPGGNSPDVAGLPRFADSSMRGEYPFCLVDFVDETFPVNVQLEAFTPLIPLNAADSGIPAAVVRYRVRNNSAEPIAVTVAGSLANEVGRNGNTFFGEPFTEYRGTPDRADNIAGLVHGSSLPDDQLGHGTMALLGRESVGVTASAKPHWVTDTAVGAREFWADLSSDGILESGGAHAIPPTTRVYGESLPEFPPHGRIGSLALSADIPAHGETTFEFVLCWCFPNRIARWPGGLFVDMDNETDEGPYVRNFYATQFGDAWEAGTYLLDNLARLEGETRAFHESLHGGTLPAEVIDAAAANIAILRSNTCFRIADGTLLGWEGIHADRGSCPGSCTHVWNYAQTVAFLFPELERSMRRVELGVETEPDGRVNFRANRVFGGEPWAVMPAVDGQLGVIIRLYRDWIISGDENFLAELWPNAVRALDYVTEKWLGDEHVLSGEQHNTYDIEFHGADPLANSLYCTALRAAAALADHLGETERARGYSAIAKRCAAAMDSLLWNGEYYAQRVTPEQFPYQYGPGCLSDQLFGELLAELNDLGPALPADRIASAISAVYRHNFRSDLTEHQHTQRIYALPDEAGLLLCSWPRGERPQVPLSYCDEIWAGIEYQVAAHLIYQGFVAEGLSVVRATRARYDGYLRNPWSEMEAGHFYVRSMASWMLLLACTGFHYNAVTSALRIDPAVPGRGFFSTGSAWGTVESGAEGLEIRVRYGQLPISSLTGPWRGAVRLNDTALPHQHTATTTRFTDLTLHPTDVLRIAYVE